MKLNAMIKELRNFRFLLEFSSVVFIAIWLLLCLIFHFCPYLFFISQILDFLSINNETEIENCTHMKENKTIDNRNAQGAIFDKIRFMLFPGFH